MKNFNRIIFLTIALISIFTSYYSIFIKYDNINISILTPGEKIFLNKYFATISSLINNDYDGFIFLYMNDICFSCPSGKLIRLLEKTKINYKNIDFIVILSNEYTSTDIENLVYNYSLSLKITSIEKNLAKSNNQKQNIKLASLPDAFAFLVNSEGIVTDVTEINLKNYHIVMNNWLVNLN